jgi:autotransporter-associated beta strand protein
VPNTISGAGQLRVDCPIGAGTIELTGANDFTGAVNVASGALRITNSAALGEGSKTITVSNGTAGNPQLRLDGSAADIELPADFTYLTSNDSTGAIINEAGDNRIAGTITLTSGGGSTRLVAQAGTLTVDANLAPNTTGRYLKLKGAATGIINGAIANGSASNVLLGIEKSDGGTWTLNGAITHTGNITCIGGTLFVNGGVTAASSVSASSGTTFGGSGSINANTTISGNHEPGPGVQAFAGSVNYGSASRVQWELAANAIAGADQVSAASVTITSGAAINVWLNRAGSVVDFTDPFWSAARTFPVIAASTRTGAFALGSVSADSLGRSASWFGAFSLQHSGGNANLLWTPAPPWQQWRATYFGANYNNAAIAGANVIAAGDGLPNLVKYALGLAATTPSTTGITLTKSGATWLFTYQRPAYRPDITYAVEVRPDLISGAWSSAGITHTRIATGEIETWQASYPAGAGATYFRLKITLP